MSQFFFGEHIVRGVVADVDKTTTVIAFGRNAWTVTAPREWIRRGKDDLIVDLG